MKKINIYLVIIIICTATLLNNNTSKARYFNRTEYPIKLALMEHFTFSPGASYTFTVPYDGYYAFRLWGGNGGDSKNTWNNGAEIYKLGGSGGAVTAVAYFKNGDVLIVTVGTQGGTNAGGFNGGGNGGTDSGSIFNVYFGGGGGGATDIRLNSALLNDRILVAGGGGGGSGGSLNQSGVGYKPANGGEGGNQTAGNGYGNGFGFGGSGTAGGEGYQYGQQGIGGGGQYSGGGGGGGYYGGGGAYGSGGGGGGGSSHIGNNFTTNISDKLPDRAYFKANEKDGFVIISFLGEGKWK